MMIKLNQLLALAQAEADLAFAEGWRVPVQKRVALAAGHSTPFRRRQSAIIAEIFDAALREQNRLIVEAAKALHAEGKVPKLNAIAHKLGIKAEVLERGQKTRWKEAIGKVKEIRQRKPAIPSRVVDVDGPIPQPERNCRCGCTDRTDSQNLIFGYLPACWAEYSRWRQIDEGARQRTA